MAAPKMSMAQYLRVSRSLMHAMDGLYFQGAHRLDSPLAKELERVETAIQANRAEYQAWKDQVRTS